MKFISLFGKTPQHRKFSYTPRFYDAQEEERREREERIKAELSLKEEKEKLRENADTDSKNYRSRISGSFKTAKRSSSRQSDSSASLLRLIILTFLAVLLVAFFQFGNVALYGLLLFIPFYLFLKLRNKGRRNS